MRKRFLLFLLASSCTHFDDTHEELYTHELPAVFTSKPPPQVSGPAATLFYLLQNDKVQEAVDLLLEAKKSDPYLFHSPIIHQFGLSLLEQGLSSRDFQDCLSSLVGVGITKDDATICYVEKALHSNDPQTELAALWVLSNFDSSHADELIEQAMKSNFVFVRLEAAHILASKKSPSAFAQIEALMQKIDPDFMHLFPKLFALDGSYHASAMLRKLLFDSNERVRLEAILACAEFGRDDFLEDIRRLAQDPSPLQQEACAHALAALKDIASMPLLRSIAAKKSQSTLAANIALYKLGDQTALDAIFDEARRGNLFAIRAISEVPESQALLISLQNSDDLMIRVNATLSLLKKKHSSCLSGIALLLIDSHQDYTFQPVESAGGSFQACRVIASSTQNNQKNPSLFEVSLRFREMIVQECAALPEEDFLRVATLLLETNQKDLIPSCVKALEACNSEKAIALLKQYAQKVGAPFVRTWCQLALYRLHETGSEQILTFLSKHENQHVFQARPLLVWRMRPDDSPHQMSLDESSRLVLESYQALAEKQNEEALTHLLLAIRDGNRRNRYALSGLLMRSSQ